ncbi:MAG: cadherin-like domain-containing protein, partial [Nonlabens ulvanivorans]|uniref:Ig-like domain-containing protein n=1 Tax=Nonlabens ulvanivorans TaxID=906888 RepID=UPI003263905B
SFPIEVDVFFTGEVFPSEYYIYDETLSTWVQDESAIFFDGYATIQVDKSTHKGFFNVNENNTLPQVFVESITNTQNQVVTIDLLENASDADGDTVEVTHIDEVSLAGGMITWSTDNLTHVTYTPPVDFIGVDRFSFIITDNNGGFTTSDVEIETTESIIEPEIPPVVIEPEDPPVIIEPEDPPVIVEPEEPPVVIEPEESVSDNSNSSGGSLSVVTLMLLLLFRFRKSAKR